MDDAYKNMIRDTEHPYCWCCGRNKTQAPSWWHKPFRIERAHIVNKPRDEDVRAVVLLCTLCHEVQHGAIHREAEHAKPFPAITLANMLWMKWKFDRKNLDVGYLRTRSIQDLPEKERPHRRYRVRFVENQPFHSLHGQNVSWENV